MILKKWTCSIPDYPTEIKVSESKRAKYWKSTDKLPLKVKNMTTTIGKDSYLFDSQGERIVKNTKTVGKPRMLTINSQKIYVGIHHSVRSKIVNELHELFNKEFKKQLPAVIDTKDKKIMIGLHFYDIYHTKLPDLDNLSNLFIKTGIDCLTTPNNPNQTLSNGVTHKLSIIPDDKMIFIKSILVEYTSVLDVKDRKLDFSIYEVTPDFTIESLLKVTDETKKSLQ